MIDLGAFETLAQFAIAQAGFASVVVVLRRGQEQFHPADGFRIANALVPSILAGFLALLPIGLAEVGLSAGTIWTSVSLVYVVTISLLAIQITARLRRLPDEARGIVSTRLFAFNFGMVMLAIVACLLNATTPLLGPPQGGFYFLGSVVLLAIGAAAFVRLVFIRPPA